MARSLRRKDRRLGQEGRWEEPHRHLAVHAQVRPALDPDLPIDLLAPLISPNLLSTLCRS